MTILISIDGVVQSGNFSVISTIDFGTAAGTSTCNFIIHLGTEFLQLQVTAQLQMLNLELLQL